MPNYQSFNYNTQSTKAHVKPTLAQKCHIAGQEPTPSLSTHPQLKKPLKSMLLLENGKMALTRGAAFSR